VAARITEEPDRGDVVVLAFLGRERLEPGVRSAPELNGVAVSERDLGATRFRHDDLVAHGDRHVPPCVDASVPFGGDRDVADHPTHIRIPASRPGVRIGSQARHHAERRHPREKRHREGSGLHVGILHRTDEGSDPCARTFSCGSEKNVLKMKDL
jgi:hypothetical protein